MAMYTSSPASHNQTVVPLSFSNCTFHFQRINLNCCTSRLPQQASSSFEENPRWLWKHIFQHNQLTLLPRSFFQTLYSSIKLSNWLWFFNHDSVLSSSEPRLFTGHTSWTQIYWCCEIHNQVINVFTQTNSIFPLKLKFFSTLPS